MRPSSICTTGPRFPLIPFSGPVPASMVGSIVLASEVSLLLLVPTSMPPTQIKCAKEILRYLAVGDVNGDGIADIVFATSGASPPEGLFTYIGKGDGTFQSPGLVMALPEGYPSSIALGDFNGDGKLDAVNGDAAANAVYLHPGNGDGTFSTGTAIAVSEPPQQVLVTDMNRDGQARY